MKLHKISVKKVIGKGKSIFATINYTKGDIIFVISGPIVTRLTRYTIPITQEVGIDPVPFNNPGRFLNHSCEPNAGIKKRSLVVALKDIKKGEEITIDYAMIVDEYGEEITERQLICKCGSNHCRGRLGSYDRLPSELKNKYKGFISDWLIYRK